MRADEYLMIRSLLDKPGLGMTSSEKSNRRRGEWGKEVAQWGVVWTLKSRCRNSRSSFAVHLHVLTLSLKHLTEPRCLKVKQKCLIALVRNSDSLRYPLPLGVTLIINWWMFYKCIKCFPLRGKSSFFFGWRRWVSIQQERKLFAFLFNYFLSNTRG